MQVSVETTSDLERRMTITVGSDSFETQINDRLKQTAGQVKLRGFRPGKVPLKEVRRRYGPSVRQEVASELMQSSFVEAVQTEDLKPAGSPNLEVTNLDAGADLEFIATFEVFPDVQLGDLTTVAVKKPEAEIAAQDVDTMIDKLRDQRKHFDDVERGAEDGDQVTVDFVGRLDGEEFEGGKGEDVTLILGQGQMLEDFETSIRGLQANQQKTFVATFPDDYHAENLRGKAAEFDLTVKRVQAPHLPELDAEFFKAFGVEEGGEEGGEEAFRAAIVDNMQSEMDAATQAQVKRQLLDELQRLHEIVLPHAVVHREVHVLKDQMLQRMGMYTPGGDAPDLPDALFEKEAQKRAAIGLVINQIIVEAQLEPDPDKVRERIELLAKPYDQPDQIVNWYYSNEEQLQQVEMAVLEDQVVDHVLSLAKIETLQTSYDDIISGRATAPPEPERGDDEPETDAQPKSEVEET